MFQLEHFQLEHFQLEHFQFEFNLKVGTVAALASGVPCIACPIYLDQPANAQQLFRLGMSPAPIPFSQLTSDTLTSAVKEVLNSELMKKRAKEVKMEVDKKDGVANAIAIVKKFLC
eukprot:TRINITY_DN1075_c0_g1_i4.p1 TRINITY_DN1075_c0_g1~~TRINITY_DN1075_c0_g1_i4.p1  ORF type:complete len:133 (-),score=65.34 TRINITY_DN1075_c0_g1_i4:43-390(-)